MLRKLMLIAINTAIALHNQLTLKGKFTKKLFIIRDFKKLANNIDKDKKKALLGKFAKG